MKQTQTHAWSLAGEGSIVLAGERKGSSHSGEWRGSSQRRALWREQSLALGPGPRLDVRGKTPKPLLSCRLQPA